MTKHLDVILFECVKQYNAQLKIYYNELSEFMEINKEEIDIRRAQFLAS